MAKVVKSFSLDTNRDAHLIAFIDSLPRGALSELLRSLLREHVENRRDLDLYDILQAIARLECKLDAGAVVVKDQGSAPESDPGDAPGTEIAASNLDKLGI